MGLAKMSTSSSPDLSQKHEEKPSGPPAGGLSAWLAVFAGWLLFFMTWGPLLAYGLFQDFYQTVLLSDYSASAISWIGTMEVFLVIVTGIFAGPLFDRGYMLHLMVTGCFLTVFGMMMVSLSDKYYQLFLSQGVCMGLGSGLVYVPALAFITRLFTTRRAIAIGVVTTGASISGLLFPIIFLHLQPRVGFPWTVRTLAFLQLACTAGALPILFTQPPIKPAPARSIVHWHAFKQVPFSAYFVSGFLVFMAYLIPQVYIPNYGASVLHETASTAYYQLATTNAASACGRLGAALLAAKTGGPNMLMFSIVSSTAILFAWIGVTSEAGFWVWCVFWGLCSGILISVNPVVISHPVISHSPGVMGTRLGMQWFSTGIGFLIGSPIAGVLLSEASADPRRGFLYLQVFSGAIMIGGGLFLLVPLVAISRHNKASAKD